LLTPTAIDSAIKDGVQELVLALGSVGVGVGGVAPFARDHTNANYRSMSLR
jgi:hypothetical protein